MDAEEGFPGEAKTIFEMIFSHEKPACWDRVAKEFGVHWNHGVMLTYAGVIHCPDENPLPDYVAHELVHVAQQKGMDPDAYLERYISDPEFRNRSESAAYRVQAVFLEQTISDQDELRHAKEKLCEAMIRGYSGAFDLREAKSILRLYD